MSVLKKKAGCCCGGVGCCHCERPIDTHCCFGLGDTATFRFVMDAATIHTHACEGDDSTRGTVYGAVDVDGDYDFVACAGGYVIWERQASQPECLPYWVFQPCDLSSEYILETEAEEEWSLGACMDGTNFDNIPMLCASILVCDLTPECCRPSGGEETTEPVHIWDHCCFVVDPNTCAGIKVEWWCFACSYAGSGTWEPVCLNFFWEFTTNRVTCEWDAEAERCVPIAP